MDKEKTGKFIASVRKGKGMTQQELAEKLHITSKAVSKWERGLSFPGVDLLEPLATILEVSVVDILSGEIVDLPSLPERTEEFSLEIMRKEKHTVRNAFAGCIGFLCVLILLVLSLWGPGIFQRGNPLPYLIAAASLSDRPFAEVEDGKPGDTYISCLEQSGAFLDYIAESRSLTFVEQAGSGYIFTTGTETFVVSSEIYWGRFLVWSMSDRTLSFP